MTASLKSLSESDSVPSGCQSPSGITRSLAYEPSVPVGSLVASPTLSFDMAIPFPGCGSEESLLAAAVFRDVSGGIGSSGCVLWAGSRYGDLVTDWFIPSSVCSPCGSALHWC